MWWMVGCRWWVGGCRGCVGLVGSGCGESVVGVVGRWWVMGVVFGCGGWSVQWVIGVVFGGCGCGGWWNGGWWVVRVGVEVGG